MAKIYDFTKYLNFKEYADLIGDDWKLLLADLRAEEGDPDFMPDIEITEVSGDELAAILMDSIDDL